eukprot:symbB.v1.2.039845.t1/scaffold6826.1/size15211/1
MCTSVADAFLVQSYYKLRGSFVKQSGPKTEQRLVRHHTTAFIMEYEGLLFLVIVLVVLAAQAAWKLWQRSSTSSREAVHLQREAWLTRFEGKGGTEGAPSTSEPSTLNSAAAAAPKLLRRRKPAAVWAAEAEEGPKVKSDSPVASAGSPMDEPPASSEVVALSEDLSKIPGSATALEIGEATVPADEPDEPDLMSVLTPRSNPSDENPSMEPEMEQQPEETWEQQPEVQVQEEPQEEEQVPARRSISETLRAASAEEEPTERTFDELLDHLEASLMQVELSQEHAVLLKRAELHLLTLLGGLRDLLMRSLRSQSRQRTMELVGCARASRLRAVLESLHLSPGRADDRLPSCRAVCDAVDAVLADFGLQETLRQEQQEKRLALQSALEEKRREEAELRKSREKQQAELRQAQLEQRQALTEALRSPQMEDESSMTVAPVNSSAQGSRSRSVKAPDFAQGDRSMLNWFLEFAEALLGEVLCFLDGISLALLEICSTWWRRLVGTNLSGIWRFVHLCALGARPPMALARPPKGFAMLK